MDSVYLCYLWEDKETATLSRHSLTDDTDDTDEQKEQISFFVHWNTQRPKGHGRHRALSFELWALNFMMWVLTFDLPIICSDKPQLTSVFIIMDYEFWIIYEGVYKKRNGRAIALPLSPNNHRLTTTIFLQSLPKI